MKPVVKTISLNCSSAKGELQYGALLQQKTIALHKVLCHNGVGLEKCVRSSFLTFIPPFLLFRIQRAKATVLLNTE